MDPALAKKLLVDPGDPVAVLGAPADHVPLFGRATNPKAARVLLLYARDRAALGARLPNVRRSLRPDARLWIVYPKAKKLGTDLNRDVLFSSLAAEGFEAVRQVAIDDTWSAMWFKQGATSPRVPRAQRCTGR